MVAKRELNFMQIIGQTLFLIRDRLYNKTLNENYVRWTLLIWFLHFNCHNRWPNFIHTWHKSSLKKGIRVCSNHGPFCSLRWCNNQIKSVSSEQYALGLSTKLGIKQFWIKVAQIVYWLIDWIVFSPYRQYFSHIFKWMVISISKDND